MTAAEIAKGLSEAQRNAILMARDVRRPIGMGKFQTEYWLPAYRDCGVLVRSIVALGLTDSGTSRLNRLGLEVRAILEGDRA
jgi:hypothetical protein